MRNCTDCQYHRDYGTLFPALCKAPQTIALERRYPAVAELERADGWFTSWLEGTCGKLGKFFKIKPAPAVARGAAVTAQAAARETIRRETVRAMYPMGDGDETQ